MSEIANKKHIGAVAAAGSAVVEAYSNGVTGDELARVALEKLSEHSIEVRNGADRATVAITDMPNGSLSMQIAGTEIGECVGVEIPIEKLTRAD